MKEKVTLQGKSLVFNALFALLNLVGLSLIVIGYHDSFQVQATWYKIIGLVVLLLSVGGLLLFRGRLMMAAVARVLVGGIFIVSGLVKANDPIGFSYKLEEYFEDGALAFRIKEWFSSPGFSMEFLIDYALFLSIVICIVEIVLGVLTIIGGKIKLVSYMLLLLMLFFTFLTWHTANCDATQKFVDHDTYTMSDPLAQLKLEDSKTNEELKIISQSDEELIVEEMKLPQCVDDCGCFGDAMKGSVGRSLTPKESFWKDIVLVYLVLWIFLAQWVIQPNTFRQNSAFIVSSVLVICFFSWVFGWYFPIFFGLISIIGALWMLRVGGKFLGNYWGSILMIVLLTVIMVGYVLMYLPLKDYRPYALGSNLIEKMNDGVEGEYESLLVYANKKTGEKREYSATSLEYTESKIWEDTDWKYESMVQSVIVPTKIPSITDQFNPFIDVSDISDDELQIAAFKEMYENAKVDGTISELSIRDLIVSSPQFVLVSSKNLMEGNWNIIDRLKGIQKECVKADVPFAVICGASREQINEFRKKHSFNAPIFVNDETELKAISRSNPTLLVIEKGIVRGKYPFRSTPSKEKFKTKHLK